jgi:TonB family protein
MKKKNFLKLPEYPGGKEEFRRYIIDNLKYPVNAMEKHIEGIVHLSADVNDDGNISGVRVEKGIGFGCDEEAVRLIDGLHFGRVTNRGIRVKTRKKFRVQFRIKDAVQKDESKKINIRYSYKKTSDQKETSDPEKKILIPVKENKFSYTVTWNTD